MNVDPTNAPAMKTSMARELHNIFVGNSGYLMHVLVRFQKLSTPAAVTNEKFSVNKFMPGDFVNCQKIIQVVGVRGPI
jgi:hypothetical protein